jgi:hypothetical protein
MVLQCGNSSNTIPRRNDATGGGSNVRGINSSGAGAGSLCAAAEGRRAIFLGDCDASGGGKDDTSLCEDATTLGETGVTGGESPRCITRQVERGISSRLTRSAAACEQRQ